MSFSELEINKHGAMLEIIRNVEIKIAVRCLLPPVKVGENQKCDGNKSGMEPQD